jgi:hypothetical protein
MKKGLSSEQRDEEQLGKLLKEGFKPLEKNIDEDTPAQQWFEQFVIEQQSLQRSKLKKDILLFLCVACLILTAFAITLLQLPILFLIIQGAVFILATAFSGISFLKQVKKI